jgi:hypothetical protein
MQGGWFSGKEWFNCFGAIPGADLVAEMSDREVARKVRSHAGRVV